MGEDSRISRLDVVKMLLVNPTVVNAVGNVVTVHLDGFAAVRNNLTCQIDVIDKSPLEISIRFRSASTVWTGFL